MVFQPIVKLASGDVVGVEALARFDEDPPRAPDVWFEEAATTGLGVDLEITAMVAALQSLEALPAGQYMAVNVSPPTLCSETFTPTLEGWPLARVVVELTEHHVIEDYDLVIETMNDLRRRGARLAVDDTGAGFASLKHILKLAPDVIKLDLHLVRDIDSDPAKPPSPRHSCALPPTSVHSSPPKGSKRRPNSKSCETSAWSTARAITSAAREL